MSLNGSSSQGRPLLVQILYLFRLQINFVAVCCSIDLTFSAIAETVKKDCLFGQLFYFQVHGS